MNRSCDKETEQQVNFGFGRIRVASMHHAANPLPGREHEYKAPQAAWLKLDRVVRVVDPCAFGFVRYERDISAAN